MTNVAVTVETMGTIYQTDLISHTITQSARDSTKEIISKRNVG